ncbi:MAG: hypothetical protein JWO02_2225, partial [Solirubrobacterales bacterium]|nr:hypothetical protein [Solirubrobacterales bacterium]
MFNDRTVWLLIGLALVLRTVLAYRHIERPGLQYDETLFVNAATDRQPGLFIFKEMAGVPMMVFPYIGALKSWLLAPAFSLFDVRPSTIRLPPIALTSAAIGVLVLSVRSLVDRRTALLVVAALVLDSSVFWLTRDDVGPTAIEFACKCGALACVARIVATRRMRWSFALVAILTLGTFNKLNFIWTVNGIAAASAVLVLAQGRSILRGPWRRPVLAWAAGMTALYGVFGWYYLHFDIGSYNKVVHDGSVLSYTWPQFVRGTNAALSGTAFHELAIGPMAPHTAVTLVLLVLFAAGTVLSLLRPTRCWPVAALSLATLLVAAQTLVIASATAPWHYAGPLPYGTIVAAYGVTAGLRLIAGARTRVVRTGLVAAALAVIAVNGALYQRYQHDLDKGRQTTIWTPLVYKVNEY